MYPAWFVLLKQWQDAGRFGLTVPFVYGALDRWPGAPLGTDIPAEKKFVALVRSIAEGTSHGTIIRLFNCGTVRDLTFAPVYAVPNFCVAIKSPIASEPSLWVAEDLVHDLPHTHDALAQILWARYGAHIVDRRYSLEKEMFVPFTDADVRLIELATARNEEAD